MQQQELYAYVCFDCVHALLCRYSLLLQLVREISERGLRRVCSSKNPEASLTGSLSREVLFTRLKPGTYALQVGLHWLQHV
jgi:hypothetical protein